MSGFLGNAGRLKLKGDSNRDLLNSPFVLEASHLHLRPSVIQNLNNVSENEQIITIVKQDVRKALKIFIDFVFLFIRLKVVTARV